METQQTTRPDPWIKTVAPWLGVFVFLLLPMYAISAAIVIKSGLFELQGNELTDAQYKALWAFIASGLGTAVTIFGLLFTRSHNQRTLAFQSDIENRKFTAEQEADKRNAVLQEDAAKRLSLDTVVKGLELIVSIDGKYAPRAKIAGALVALVHLNHPTIAIRTLSAAWDDDKVDAGTAVWIINEIYKRGVDRDSDASMVEASELLKRNATKLCSVDEGQLEWPDIIVEDWPAHIPVDARFNNIESAIDALLSRPKNWWIRGGGYGWIILLLDEIRRNEANDSVRTTATSILRLLADTYPNEGAAAWYWKGELRELSEIRKASAFYELGDRILAGTQGETLRRITDWASVSDKLSFWKKLKDQWPRPRHSSRVTN